VVTKDANVLRTATDPRTLVDTARLYAVSEAQQDQDFLLQALSSPNFLGRLNTDREYLARPPQALNAARIVKTLMEQRHEGAIRTLIALTRAPAFQAIPSLVELNIVGLAGDRPASQQTVAYWHLHSTPESSNVDIVVDTLFRNRSLPALALFLDKMNDEAHDPLRKDTWLKDPLLRRRNDAQVLLFCERILKERRLSSAWHNQLVEALFDYDERWYKACAFPRPPPRLQASREARNAMIRIGEYALFDMDLAIPGLAGRIRAELAIIGHDADAERA
jgi:hypothetical protein